MSSLKYAPDKKTAPSKKNGKLIGIRFDLDDAKEREAYDYIQKLRGAYTPRQIVVNALIAASRANYQPEVMNSGLSQEMVYQAVVEAMRQVIGDGQLIVSNGALAVQNTDGSTRAIMSQEAKNLLGFAEEFGEF